MAITFDQSLKGAVASKESGSVGAGTADPLEPEHAVGSLADEQKASWSEVRSESVQLLAAIELLRRDVAQLRTDFAVLKWMVGLVLVLVVAALGLLLRRLA